MNFEKYLPPGVGLEDAISILTGFAAFAVVTMVWLALLPANPMAGRMKSINRRRDSLRVGLLAPRRRGARIEAVTAMRTIVKRLNLLRTRHADEIAKKLTVAGWRSKDAVVVFLFLKIFLPFFAGGIAIIALYGLEVYELSTMTRLGAALIAVIAGAYLPEILVKNQATKRKKLVQKGLPDALDLMVICAEAGLGLEATLHRVSGELAPTYPELADELSLTAIELGFIPERKKALENLTSRTDMPSIRGVVNALVQTEKYGTPLAGSLRVLASEYRDERMLKAEEKAAKLPATLTVPMVVFILPTLFVVLLGPAIIKTIDGFSSMH
jgi:tight adherence protein C